MWALAVIGCAPTRVTLPTDPGTSFPDFSEVHRQVSAACVGVRTLTAELGLSGRAGGQRIRGRVVAGFARPDSMRLEGVAPFGQPAFILVSRAGLATLLLPRDSRVLRGASADEILGALTGVSLAPADLQAILTGCVVDTPRAVAGRRHANGWASIDLEGGATLYLQQSDGGWQLRAATRSGWEIEYPVWQARLPQRVRLTSSAQAAAVDLTAAISQLETNIDLEAPAFAVNVPASSSGISLDELRDAGPLRGQ